MSLQNALNILWRHKWLMLAIILVTMLAVPLRLMTTADEYSGTVKLLVTPPERITVDLYTPNRSSTAEEEINIARSNFVDVLESEETRRRVIETLGLPEALHEYKLSVNVSRETDFLTVGISTLDGAWAAEIANEHVTQARKYFGEIRAQPAALAKLALASQVADAQTQLNAADQALVAFKNEHNISSVEAERELNLAILSKLYDQRSAAALAQQSANLSQTFPELMRTLDSLRSTAIFRNDAGQATAWDDVIAFHNRQILAYSQSSETAEMTAAERLSAIISELEAQRLSAETTGAANLAQAYAYVIAFYSGELVALQQGTQSVAYIEELIATQEARIAEVNELTPEYNDLVVRAEQAQQNYETLATAYQDAVIKEDTALRADFIQVVLPASVQSRPDTSSVATLVLLGLVASVGAAIAMAFAAELLGRWLWPSETPATARTRVLDRR
jgi:uncharacterized protein involved in exopolysaccharide biosynthesis